MIRTSITPIDRSAASAAPASRTSGRNHAWTQTALIVAFVAAVRFAGMFPSAIDWDESVYILMAREILHAHLPYLTMFDDKPVGAPVLFALVMAAFGQSVFVVRALGSLCVIATALLLRAILIRSGASRPAAVAAAVMYGGFSTALGGLASNTELLFAPFSAAAVAIAAARIDVKSSIQQVRAIAACGLLIGIAIWIKYVAALPAAALIIVVISLWCRRHQATLGRGMALASIYAAACALPTALTAYVYWSRGDLALWWYSNFGFIGAYLGLREPRVALLHLASDHLIAIWPLVMLAAAAAALGIRTRCRAPRRSKFIAAMGVWTLAEAAAVIAPWKFYDHYFLVLLPPLCVLAALALEAAALRVVRPDALAVGIPIMAAAVAIVPLAGWMSPRTLDIRRPDVPRAVAAIVRNDRAPTVWVVNSEPIVYFLAGIPLPTRFPFPPHLVGFQTGYTRNDARAEVTRLLASQPALLIVDEDRWAEVEPGIAALIRRALSREYTVVETVTSKTATVDVFGHRPHTPQTPVAHRPSTS